MTNFKASWLRWPENLTDVIFSLKLTGSPVLN